MMFLGGGKKNTEKPPSEMPQDSSPGTATPQTASPSKYWHFQHSHSGQHHNTSQQLRLRALLSRRKQDRAQQHWLRNSVGRLSVGYLLWLGSKSHHGVSVHHCWRSYALIPPVTSITLSVKRPEKISFFPPVSFNCVHCYYFGLLLCFYVTSLLRAFYFEMLPDAVFCSRVWLPAWLDLLCAARRGFSPLPSKIKSARILQEAEHRRSLGEQQQSDNTGRFLRWLKPPNVYVDGDLEW